MIVHPWTLGRGADSAIGSSGRELQTFHGLQINLALLLASVLLAFRLWLFHFSWFLVTAPLHSLDTCQDPEREELEGVNPCNQPKDMVFRLQNHGAMGLWCFLPVLFGFVVHRRSHSHSCGIWCICYMIKKPIKQPTMDDQEAHQPTAYPFDFISTIDDHINPPSNQVRMIKKTIQKNHPAIQQQFSDWHQELLWLITWLRRRKRHVTESSREQFMAVLASLERTAPWFFVSPCVFFGSKPRDFGILDRNSVRKLCNSWNLLGKSRSFWMDILYHILNWLQHLRNFVVLPGSLIWTKIPTYLWDTSRKSSWMRMATCEKYERLWQLCRQVDWNDLDHPNALFSPLEHSLPWLAKQGVKMNLTASALAGKSIATGPEVCWIPLDHLVFFVAEVFITSCAARAEFAYLPATWPCWSCKGRSINHRFWSNWATNDIFHFYTFAESKLVMQVLSNQATTICAINRLTLWRLSPLSTPPWAWAFFSVWFRC